MTPERFRKIQQIARQLQKQAARAGELELTLPNGALADSLIGQIAEDLLAQLKTPFRCPTCDRPHAKTLTEACNIACSDPWHSRLQESSNG